MTGRFRQKNVQIKKKEGKNYFVNIVFKSLHYCPLKAHVLWKSYNIYNDDFFENQPTTATVATLT